MCWMTVNAPIVTAGYFETMEMRIVRGHPISTLDERGAPPVAVLNETLARRLWPGSDAVGRSLAVELFGQKSTKVIVGIVADVRTSGNRLGRVRRSTCPSRRTRRQSCATS